jgi:hypothetical protein
MLIIFHHIYHLHILLIASGLNRGKIPYATLTSLNLNKRTYVSYMGPNLFSTKLYSVHEERVGKLNLFSTIFSMKSRLISSAFLLVRIFRTLCSTNPFRHSFSNNLFGIFSVSCFSIFQLTFFTRLCSTNLFLHLPLHFASCPRRVKVKVSCVLRSSSHWRTLAGTRCSTANVRPRPRHVARVGAQV